VTDRDAVFELARKVPRVDILVNNAGIIPTASLLDATPEQLRKIMDVNTISHFWVSSDVTERGNWISEGDMRCLENITLSLNNYLQVKVKLSLCLIKHHAMKTYWGVEVMLHAFLISALDAGEWSRPGRFTPGERALVRIG
jgi:hypothetical protein